MKTGWIRILLYEKDKDKDNGKDTDQNKSDGEGDGDDSDPELRPKLCVLVLPSNLDGG